jgi:hypothetical protein
MTVYIDDMYLYDMGKFGRMKMSHMIADGVGELHEMARKIGVARKWYQGDHYDVCMSKRTKAIEMGAVACTLKQLAAMSYLQKHDCRYVCDPDTAIQMMLISKAGTRNASVGP